jgi:hypothetical protein
LEILVVIGRVLFFFLKRERIVNIVKPSMPSPKQEIEKCVKNSVEEAVSIMLPQGGYINPDNYYLYQNNKVEYLCYTNKYYFSCINQEPLYTESLEEEIHNYIEPKIKDCFYSLTKEYEDKGYDVVGGDMGLDVELRPKQIIINMDKKLTISREEAESYDKFKFKINSPLYNLGVVAQEIANQEAKYCNFAYLGYSLLYPFEIEKKQVGSGETISDIYIIKDKTTEKELLIGIRSCAMPGGL